MATYTGFVDNTGAYANQNMLQLIHDKLVLEGWTILRYITGTAVRELIASSTGLSGTEQIFIGFRSYESVPADYYNLSVAAFTGYVSGNDFDAQPGYVESGVCGHNLRIDYWLAINAQRVLLAMKVGTPVYETAYVGKFFPYATPSQYPYPMVCIGTLAGLAATRYSDTVHTMGFRGNVTNSKMRSVAGTWIQPRCWPYNADTMATTSATASHYQGQQRDTGGVYNLNPIMLMTEDSDIFGELDGVYHISGFGNAVENTLSISGRSFVVMQDVGRTGFNDYVAMEF